VKYNKTEMYFPNQSEATTKYCTHRFKFGIEKYNYVPFLSTKCKVLILVATKTFVDRNTLCLHRFWLGLGVFDRTCIRAKLDELSEFQNHFHQH